MSNRSVETGRVDLVLGDLVGEGHERNPAAAEIRRSVDTPLVLAKGERRKKARAPADHALREELGRPLIHHPGSQSRHQDDVVGQDGQVHDFARRQGLTGGHRAGIENRGFGGDGDRFVHPADLHPDIDLDLSAHREDQVGANGFLESGGLHRYLVLAARQQAAIDNSRSRWWSVASRRWSRCWLPARWRRLWPPHRGRSPFLKSYPWCPVPARTTPPGQKELQEAESSR